MPDAGVRVIEQWDGTVTDNGNGARHVKVTVTKDGNPILFGRLKAEK